MVCITSRILVCHRSGHTHPAAKSPPERLNSIREGLQTLAYGQSEYVRVCMDFPLTRETC